MVRLETEIIRREGGDEYLLVPRVRLSVVSGPDQGQTRTIEAGQIVIGSGRECSLCLSDPAVSRQHVSVVCGDLGIVVRDLGSTNGTFISGVRLTEVTLTAEATIELGVTKLQVTADDKRVEVPLSSRTRFGALVGSGIAMRRVFAVLERAAETESTVLIQGASGTGKELAARSIHQASARCDGPFVVVDCGALSKALIESEFFGHEKGAFTGAAAERVGAMEQADGGTLLLDEVGELDIDLQPRLLRFLQEREVRRVGSSQSKTVDVRVVAATNRRLETEVEQGRFRQDLYFRLAVMQVELPTLAEHPEDILPLAERFAKTYCEDASTLLSAEIQQLLTSYSWPGNVRELRNTIERLAVLPELGARGLQQSVESTPKPSIGALANLPFHQARQTWQDIFEQQYLGIQLARAEEVVSWAAKCAGLPRQTFNRLLRKHGMNKPRGD